jgi:hypothetical protein
MERSIAQAMRLEGWPRARFVQAAILRDASHRPTGDGLLLSMDTQFMVRVQRRFRRWGLRMRAENLDTIGFMESLH